MKILQEVIHIQHATIKTQHMLTMIKMGGSCPHQMKLSELRHF